MSDFSIITDDTQIRRKPGLQQQQQTAAGSTPGDGAAAAGTAPRMHIALPSFREVQAAQRPSAPPNAFQPGFLNRQQTGQQQQQQQQQTGQQQQQHVPAGLPPAAPAGNAGMPGVSGPGRPTDTTQQQQQQPIYSNTFYSRAAADAAGAAGAAGGSGMGLSMQLPRYNQTAAGAGAAPAPIGVARVTPAAAAAAGGAAGGAAAGPANAAAGSNTGAQRAAAQQAPLNAVLVSQRQQGNPVLKQLRGVRWAFSDSLVPDYLCGANTAVLFLSLRYHLLQPEYVLHRLAAVQRAYRLLVLLLLVDVEEVVKPLQELHRAAMGADAVLICAWSNEECARYIETLKAYENKPASSIMEARGTDYLGRLTAALTAVRGVNRSDAFSLASRFGSLAEAMQADQEDFAAIPGLGPVKARRLLEAFSQPFKRNLTGAQGAAAAGAGTSGGGASGEGGGSAGQQQASSSQHSQQQPAAAEQQQEEQQQGDEDVNIDLEDYEDWDEDAAAADDEQEQEEDGEEADEPGGGAAAPAGVGDRIGAAAGPGQQGRGEFLPLPPQDDEYGYDDELLEEF